MKNIVNAIADSLQTEVATPSGWTIQRFDPIWRNPEEGPMLYVFTTGEAPGGFRTTGTRQDICEVIVELVEATGSTDALTRDATAELNFLDKAKSLKTWADSHQSLPPNIDQLDYIRLATPADVRREAAVRYAQLTIHARETAVYA